MKVLVAGCTGYTGAHTVQALRRAGIEVVGLARHSAQTQMWQRLNAGTRLTIFETVEDLPDCLHQERPTHVVNCAGLSVPDPSGPGLSHLLEANITFGLRLLDAMAQAGGRHFIWTGSYWQYANGAEEQPNSCYAATKSAFRMIATQMAARAGLSLAEMILYDSYGLDDPRGKIVGLFAQAAKAAAPVAVSPGDQLLWPVWIEDVAAAIVAACTWLEARPAEAPTVVCSWGAPGPDCLSLRDMAGIYSREAGLALNISWGARAYPEHQIMRPHRVDPPPGWKAKINFAAGCRQILGAGS